MKHLKEVILHVVFHTRRLEQESITAILAIGIEYYNLFTIGYLSQIIEAHFFATSSPLIPVMLFLLSFFTTPLGAIVCGHIGDKLGRKKILVWTITFIAIPSLLISILPSYDEIGIFASLAFIFLRLVQSFAFGGELIGLITFVLEDVPMGHRGLFGGLMSSGASLGVMFASLAIAVSNSFGNEIIDSSWSWRVLLLIGFLGIFIAIYFHRTLSETATFRHYKRSQNKIKWPVYSLLNGNFLSFLKVCGAFSLAPIITIVIFGFLPHLGSHHLNLFESFKSFSMWSNTAGLFLFAICAPCFGSLSDKIGRKRVIYGLTLCYLVFAYPLFSFIVSGDFLSFFVGNLFFAFIASAYYGVMMTMCIEQFPTYIRFTGVGVGYVISHTIFGDISGSFIVKELIIHVPTIEFAPVFYLFFGCIVVIFCTIFMKEKSKKQLT